jgi:hypothetical protein
MPFGDRDVEAGILDSGLGIRHEAGCLLCIHVKGSDPAQKDERESKGVRFIPPNFLRSAIASGLATGGRIARKIPSANVIGDLPAASFTSSVAPWSARI